MTIVRRCHPFEGQALEILGRTHRRGNLHLVLVLPDGTRSLVPAAWTDLHGTPEAQAADPQTATLASIEQLLHTRALVDALQRRFEASDRQVPMAEEDKRATTDELSEGTTRAGRGSCVGRAGQRAEDRDRDDARSPNRKRRHSSKRDRPRRGEPR